jgi:energy-coupling factor transport system permease protein
MQPLEKLGLSPRKLSLMIGIALRFIPTVFEEADKIRKAQASRGMDLADLPLARKARLLVSLLVPVTVASIRRALELAESMEARGYKLTGTRSKFHELAWSIRDTTFVAVIALLAAVLILFGG